jgi:hypothetical protein
MEFNLDYVRNVNSFASLKQLSAVKRRESMNRSKCRVQAEWEGTTKVRGSKQLG